MPIIVLPSRAAQTSGNVWVTVATGPCVAQGFMAANPGNATAQLRVRATLNGVTAAVLTGADPDSTLAAGVQTSPNINPIALDTGDVLQVTSDEPVDWILWLEGEA